MRILFVGNETQQVTHIAYALDRMGHEVAVYPMPVERIAADDGERKKFEDFLKRSGLHFVISNIFHPYPAEATHRIGLKYVVYGMDSPMFSLYRYAEQAKYDNCYLFLMDRAECERLQRMGYANVRHMPLGIDAFTAQNLSVTDEEIGKYRCDVSFVGSLYSDNVYDRNIARLSESARERCEKLLSDSVFLWDGEDRMSAGLTPELVGEIGGILPDMEVFGNAMGGAEYLRTWFFARKWTNLERASMLSLLAECCDLRLYTWDHQTVPDNVRRFSQVSFEDSLKIYHAGKINLNITLRSIESGIPLRVFDIMSVGGFVLTNRQPEIAELFEEGREIVTFRTPEEMLEKVDYYLTHEEERLRVALNGYRKVSGCCTFEQRLRKIIAILYPAG